MICFHLECPYNANVVASQALKSRTYCTCIEGLFVGGAAPRHANAHPEPPPYQGSCIVLQGLAVPPLQQRLWPVHLQQRLLQRCTPSDCLLQPPSTHVRSFIHSCIESRTMGSSPTTEVPVASSSAPVPSATPHSIALPPPAAFSTYALSAQ